MFEILLSVVFLHKTLQQEGKRLTNSAGRYNLRLLDLALPGAHSYLARRLGVDETAIHTRELGGGVSNTVVLVEAPGLRCVAKQSLDKLRVEQDWRCARDRIFRECDAIRALGPILPPERVPRILFEDRENFIFAMSAAPEHAEPWKTRLLAGHFDDWAARCAGETLGTWIRASSGEKGWTANFAGQEAFDDLRLDPYYRSTASRHPELKHWLAALIEECRERRVALVHGDFSPKNILLWPAGMMVIDFEVIHYGDPSFDAAFLSNHLLLKAFYRSQWASRYRWLNQLFWEALKSHIGPGFDWLAGAAVRHLAGLLLARIDGKSPAEYIQEDALKQRIRDAARSLIAMPPTSTDAAFARFFA
jgi:aminoglycoside phosphotransferase (APT) family kinase protein